MKSPTSTNRLSAPLSKRTVFTSITPLPLNVSRAAAVDFLHDYETMIDINPLIIDRHRIPPPPEAEADEAHCTWYQLTDTVVMPWSASSPASADTTSAKTKPGNVSYTCAFHPLPDGMQTHCRAPLGVDIRDRWTIGGTEPGEPKQPLELGLASLGAPSTGLYLREDVDLRCNRLMAGFVKKTLKKSHEGVVEKLKTNLSNTSPTSASGSNSGNSSKPIASVPAMSKDKPRPASMASPLHAQRPTPYRVYSASHQPPAQNQAALQTEPQGQNQTQTQTPTQQQPLPLRQYPTPQQLEQYQRHEQQQRQQQPHRQHQYTQSYSNVAAVPTPAPFPAPAPAPVAAPVPTPAPSQLPFVISRKSVPASLAVGPPSSSQQLARETQLQSQQQNQEHQRFLHPFFPQMDGATTDDHILVDPTSLSSPPLSVSSVPKSVSTASSSTASAADTTASTPASSPNPSLPSSHSSMPYDRFKMNASPLTRLQMQLPKISTVKDNDDAGRGGLYADKEQRHSLYQQLLPPLVFSAREVATSEPRRRSTGSDATSLALGGGASSVVSGAASDIPFHDLSLCPRPLRIGGQRRVSTDQRVPTLPAAKPAPTPAAQMLAPFRPTLPTETHTRPGQTVDYPAMNPYVYNEDDYEDVYVDSPILASDARGPNQKGPYSPTVFADMDAGAAATLAPATSNEDKPALFDWQQRRRFLAVDLD
ncbi:uncharacterized protein SPSK_03142 [Sporothrix schenckii 1099-18]|uniref:DUF7053 domain-containing protein n=1 Tax=Sporothrix schenckii 1099-18 TaxID=1397361 RepID=A0A0F2LXQ4_SPOSC|nr:uncharacterized protein SPSK_03142 [Sporothrix schenckii 1099-18]KJR82247.1 hypothetical protein SPSK_03142 [Sporothrix schenckii 1099-18]